MRAGRAMVAVLLFSAACKSSSSHSPDAPVQTGLLDFVYIVGAGPGINGQTPPAAQLYALSLAADGTLTPIGMYSAIGGVVGLVPNNTPTRTNYGHLYLGGTSGGFKVMEIGMDGALVDTGLLTGSVTGPVAFLPTGGTYDGYAYVITTGSGGDETINEYGVNPDGTFQSLGTLPAGNNVAGLEFFSRPIATSHLPNASGSTLGALYAPGVASIGQWTINVDGTLTAQPTVVIPGADPNTGCNLLSAGANAIAIGEANVVGSDVDLYVLQDLGNLGVGCGYEHTAVIGFSIDKATGLLTQGNTIQLPSTQSNDIPQQLTAAGPGLAYASARGETRSDTTCGDCGGLYKIYSATDDQIVAGVSDTAPTASIEVDSYTLPTTTVCPACVQCANMAQDGSLPQSTVAIGADPTGAWLLVSDPGIGYANATATTASNYCIPLVTSVTKPATLQTYAIASDGSLTLGGSYTLGANQYAMTINFLNYVELVNPHGGN